MSYIELKAKLFSSQIISDSFWSLLGNVIAKGLNLVGAILIARFLGKEVYGEYGVIRNTLLAISMFSTFGIGYSCIKFIAQNKDVRPLYTKYILKNSLLITTIFSGMMALVLFFSAKHIAIELLEISHLVKPLSYTAIWVFFNAVTVTQIGILSGYGEFKLLAKINILVGVISFFLAIVLTYLWGLEGALVALLIAQVMNWYCNVLAIKKNNLKARKAAYNKKVITKVLKFSLPIALQEGVFAVSYWVVYMLLVKYSNYGEVGLYSAAMQWSGVILFIPSILRNVILSHMSNSNNNHVSHQRILDKTLLFTFLVTFVPFLMVFSFSDVLLVLYGESFKGIEEVMYVALVTTIFMSLSNVYTQAYLSKGRNWLMLKIRIFRDISIPVLTYVVLLNQFGNMGAVAVVSCSLIINIVFLFLMAIIYKRYVINEC